MTLIPFFQSFKFVRVCSLVGRYIHNVYIVKTLKIVFSLNFTVNNIFLC